MREFKKKDLVEFIHTHYRYKSGKKITKTYLNQKSNQELLSIIEKNDAVEQFKIWAAKPKLIEFMVDGIQNGKDLSWDCEAKNEEECRKNFEEEGITVLKIVEKSKNHRCLYCNGIADGKNPDRLCDDCTEVFGHLYYSEL